MCILCCPCNASVHVLNAVTAFDAVCRSDKDEEIVALREEGEKLSKQQLQNSNTIKKLRAKEQENRKLIAGLK